MKMHGLTAAVLVALVSTAVFAASEGGDTWSTFGTPVQSQKVDRTVHVEPHSRWANVNYGETVRFVAQSGDGSEKSFAWRFNVSPEVNSVDLSTVAPANFPRSELRVYVEPDPRYIVN
jgi:hypothetical protein